MRRLAPLLLALLILTPGCGAGFTLNGAIKLAGAAAQTACRVVLREELAAVERADEEPPVNDPESSETSGGEQ